MLPDRDVVLMSVDVRLDEANAAHALATAETARMMALLYGVDADEAWTAGALHDWDRELDAAELVERARQMGLDVTEADTHAPRLLHARTGAIAVAASHPGIPQRVVDAIARHTLGDVEMTELDMIVYVADMIEPGRSWSGVNDLREAVGTIGLKQLFARAFTRTLTHLVDQQRYMHPRAVDVWNSLVVEER